MIPILTTLVIATAFSSATPTGQPTSTELSLPRVFQRSIWDSDALDFLLPEDGSPAIHERDNGDIASGLDGWQSRMTRSSGLLQWTFGNNLNQYNISMDTCLKKSSVIGVWQSQDGTTNNDATIGDIMADLGFGTGSVVPYERYSARILQNAMSAVSEAQTLMDTILCTSPTATQLENQAQLRHLLFESQGKLTAVVMGAAYAVVVYYFYNIIALYVTNPAVKLLITGTGNLGIIVGLGIIGFFGATGDLAPIEASFVGSVFVARMRQMILQATQAGRVQGPCLPITQVTAAAVQGAANAAAPAVAGVVQAVANTTPPAGAGAADGAQLARSGSCPVFRTPVRR